jgi:hypothetical protein
MDGVGSSQQFAPATDNISQSNLDTTFCGPKVYSVVIVGGTTQNFASTSFAGSDEYVNNWTLQFFSTSLIDVGVWSVTLSASLANYGSVP